MSDIFLSYQRDDRNRVKTLAEALERAGWSVWWDPHLRSGEHFDEVIERELKSAKCVIVVWSDRSIRSQYVKDEAAYALKLNKLIPIAIDDVELPFRYQGLQTIFLTEFADLPSFAPFQKLLDELAGVIGTARKVSKSRKTQSRTSEKATARPAQTNEKWVRHVLKGGITVELPLVAGPGDTLRLRLKFGESATFQERELAWRGIIDQFMKENGYQSYDVTERRDDDTGGSEHIRLRFSRDIYTGKI